MRALAESLGVSTGELRKMAEEGKLTATLSATLMVGSVGKLRAEAALMPDTVGGAMTRLSNDVKLAVNELNQNSGLTLGIAGLVNGVRELMPAVKTELGGAFQSVGEWVERNRESLGEVWDVIKSIVGDVWQVVKAAGGVLGALWEWELQTGLVKKTLEGVRLTIALVRDGVELLSGYFAIVGSKILQGVLAPLNLVLKASAGIAGVFDEELAAKIRGISQGIDDFAQAGEKAGRDVFDRFREGRTHTAALGNELATTATKNAQLKAALDGSGVSASANSQELQRLAARADAASGGFTKLTGSVGESAEAKKAAAKAAQALQKDLERQGDLLAELSGYSKDYADKVRDLTAVYARGGMSLDEFNKYHDTLLSKQPLVIAQTKAAVEAAKEQNKAFDDAFEAIEKKRVAEEAQIKTARTMLEQLEFETAALKMSTTERALATAARELERQGIVKGTLAYEAYIERIREAVVNKDTVQQTIDAQKKIEEGWRSTADSIFDAVTDSLFRGAEAGKGFFESLADTAKGMFRNLVLQPTIKAVGTSIAGSLGSSLASAAGMAMPTTGADGKGLDGIGSLASVAGSLFGAGGLGGSLAAGAGWLTGATTLGGSLAAAGSLAATGTMGGIASGLGMAAGALGPIAIGIALASSLIKKRGGPKPSGSAGTGSQYRVYDSGALDESLGNVLAGTNASYAATASALGATRDNIAGTQFGYYAATDPQGTAQTQLVVQSSVNGQQTYFRNGENVGRGEGELEKAIANSTAQAVLASLKASNIDADAKAYLESKAAMAGSADDINKLLTVLVGVKEATSQIDGLGGVFSRISDLSIDARAQLFDFAGGIESFLEKTRSYVDQYFNDAEKAAITARDIATKLADAGITADLTTRQSLRDLVNATDVSTEAGQRQLAVLLDVADDFASISAYLESQGQTLSELAELAPKNDLIAKLTGDSVTAQKDTGDAVLDVGASTLAIGADITGAVNEMNSKEDQRNAEVLGALQAIADKLDAQAGDAETASATIVNGLTNLRRGWDDVTSGNALRVKAL